MAENRKRLTGRSQKQQPRQRRQLRFEPLESRSLLSAIAVAAPGARSNVPPVEWLPRRIETVSPAAVGQNANLLAQADALRQPIPSLSAASLVTSPAAEVPNTHLFLEDELVSLAPASSGYPHDLTAESMVTLTRSPPRDSMAFLGGRAVSYDLMPVGDSVAALASHEESSGLAGSIAEPPTALPESRLSVEVVFVSLEPAFAGYDDSPTGHSIMTKAQSAPARSVSLSAGADTLRTAASFLGTRSDTTSGDDGSLARSTPGQSSMLAASNPVGDSGSAALPASGSDLGLSSPARLAGSPPADSPDAEGGYVEIDNVPLESGLSTPAPETPMWSLDGATIGDPITRGDQQEDVPPGVGGIAKDDGRTADARSDDIVQLELAEQDSAHSPNAAEGGMIELAAATPQNTQPISTKSPMPEYGDPLPNVKEVELDNGLGLFHAFELATAPTQRGDQAGTGSEKASEAVAPPAANVAPMPTDPSVIKNSTFENSSLDRRAALRPAALSSVLLVGMLVPIGGILREKRSSENRRSSP